LAEKKVLIAQTYLPVSGLIQDSEEVWPDEALEKGSPGLSIRERKTWRRAGDYTILTKGSTLLYRWRNPLREAARG